MEVNNRPASVTDQTGNRQILEDFIAEIERLSGLGICVYDLNFFVQDSKEFALKERHRFHSAPICELMKSRKETLARCVKTENAKTAKSIGHPGGCVHRCYAGVSDFILPLQVHDRHLGAIMIGQTVAADPAAREAKHRELMEKYGFTRKELAAAARQMKPATAPELVRNGRIAALVKDYIERVELLISLESEYHIRFSYNARSAEEAVRMGKLPLRTLHEVRTRLGGSAGGSLRKAVDVIQAKFAGKLSQREVAKSAGMSVSHFSREFRKQTGRTFRVVLMETRLGAAFFLTKKYGITVSEAAYLVGYSDEFTFRRAFRALRGMSITTFMRKYPRAFDINEK